LQGYLTRSYHTTTTTTNNRTFNIDSHEMLTMS
jgi:hypothetical protein